MAGVPEGGGQQRSPLAGLSQGQGLGFSEYSKSSEALFYAASPDPQGNILLRLPQQIQEHLNLARQTEKDAVTGPEEKEKRRPQWKEQRGARRA